MRAALPSRDTSDHNAEITLSTGHLHPVAIPREGEKPPVAPGLRCTAMGEWTILERLLEAAVQQHSTMIGR